MDLTLLKAILDISKKKALMSEGRLGKQPGLYLGKIIRKMFVNEAPYTSDGIEEVVNVRQSAAIHRLPLTRLL